MVRDVHPAVQKPKRLEKGKPPRQHDHAGVGAEYAGRGHHHGNFQAEGTGDPFGEHRRGPCRWQGGWRRTEGH